MLRASVWPDFLAIRSSDCVPPPLPLVYGAQATQAIFCKIDLHPFQFQANSPDLCMSGRNPPLTAAPFMLLQNRYSHGHDTGS